MATMNRYVVFFPHECTGYKFEDIQFFCSNSIEWNVYYRNYDEDCDSIDKDFIPKHVEYPPELDPSSKYYDPIEAKKYQKVLDNASSCDKIVEVSVSARYSEYMRILIEFYKLDYMEFSE